MVIDRSNLRIFGYTDRVQMAGNGFFPIGGALLIGCFQTTFYGSVIGKDHIGTFASVYQWRFPIPILTAYKRPLHFYCRDPFRSKERLHLTVYVYQYFRFPVFQRGPGITIYTTGTFAGTKITDKIVLYNFFRHQSFSQLEHTIKFNRKYTSNTGIIFLQLIRLPLIKRKFVV